MHSLLLVTLFAALCYANTDSNQPDIETLTDNVLVLRVPYGQGSRVFVGMTCGEAYQNQPVFWKKNGEVLRPALQGNQVNVLVVEMDGGNYTCHHSSDGRYLNHTLILVQLDPDNRTVILEEKSPLEGHIQCSAPNYTGSFHCTWKKTADRPNAAVLLWKAERNLEKISCMLDADGSGVQCSDASCQHHEEQQSISLTIYMYSFSRLEAYTKTFFLRDIVRPAKLTNLQISDGRVLSWNYPTSWEKPCSFFRLQFQVKVVHSNHDCNDEEPIMQNITENTHYAVSVKTKRFVFCVRAQDKFTGGPFSHWSTCTVTKNNVHC